MAKSNRRRRERNRKLRRLAAVVVVVLVVCIVAIAIRKNQGGTVGIAGGITQLPQDVPCVVCVDPGHGGKDQGSSYGDRLEKDDNLAVGLALRDALLARGVTVVMTREDDTYLSLEDRVWISTKAEADYYISLHRNYSDTDACGVEIWVSEGCSDEARELADLIDESLSGAGVQEDRGVRTGSESGEGSYYVLRNTVMPAVLIELGFMQDETDNRLLDENTDEYAAAIAGAVVSLCTKNQE